MNVLIQEHNKNSVSGPEDVIKPCSHSGLCRAAQTAVVISKCKLVFPPATDPRQSSVIPSGLQEGPFNRSTHTWRIEGGVKTTLPFPLANLSRDPSQSEERWSIAMISK